MSVFTVMHAIAGCPELTSEVADYGTFDDAMIACVIADNFADWELTDSYFFVLSTKDDVHHCADYENYGHHCDEELATSEAEQTEMKSDIPF